MSTMAFGHMMRHQRCVLPSGRLGSKVQRDAAWPSLLPLLSHIESPPSWATCQLGTETAATRKYDPPAATAASAEALLLGRWHEAGPLSQAAEPETVQPFGTVD